MGSSRATSLAKIGALLASLASSSLAVAQPKPTQVQIQAAGDLVKKAIAKSQAGDHTLAIELYQQAYTIIPQPILLSNIGAEYQLSQQPADAVTYFCKYLAAEPAGANAQFATGQVKSIQAQQNVETEEDDVCKVKPKLAAPLPPPIPEVPLTGFGPAGGPSTEPASHPGRGLEIAGVAVAVVGGVSVALGVHYALNGRNLSRDIDAHVAGEPWPATIDGVPIKDWQSQGDAWNRDAYIFSIVGGAAVIAGVTMFVMGHGNSATEHARLVPVVTPNQSGFAVVGRF